jgi:hypothetical protein
MVNLKRINMKFLTSCLLAVFLTINTQAQVVWSFTSNAVTATGAPAGITAGSIGASNPNGTAPTFGAAGTPASSAYSGASGGGNGNIACKTGVLNSTTSTYFQVVLTPATGNAVRINGINWGNFSLATSGPLNIAIRTSLDNYAADIATATVTQSATAWQLVSPTITPIVGNVGAALTLRVYGYAGTGTSPAAGAVNWRIDDVKVTAEAVPSSSASGSLNFIPKFQSVNSLTNSQIFDNGTNVGIGTTAPSAKLDVNGTFKLVNGSQGANKVLTSDANGLASWVAPTLTGAPVSGSTNYIWNSTTLQPSSNFNISGNGIVAGSLSSPGSGPQSEKFGLGAEVSQYSTAFGYNAQAIGIAHAVAIGRASFAKDESIAIGSGANASSGLSTTTQYRNIAIGNGAATEGVYNTALGAFATISAGPGGPGGNGSIAIGGSTQVSHAASIVLGYQTSSTAQNQVVIGSAVNGSQANDVIFGMGAKSVNAGFFDGVSLRTTDADGTNVPGTDLQLKPGRGTGSAFGGDLRFATANAGAAGSTLGTYTERMKIKANGQIGLFGLQTDNALNKVLVSDANGYLSYRDATSLMPTITAGWNLTGNTGTNAATNFIGTTDNQDLVIKTSNTEQLRVQSGGNVGIGITTPREKLDVGGSIIAGGNQSAYLMMGTNGNNSPFIQSNQNPIVMNVASTNALTITTSSVGGNIVGAVGIGTNGSPIPNEYRLAVAGNIIAEKLTVKLRANWPDFVFEDDFRLKSLSEIEKYIKVNKHLPGVPSAKQIAKDGVDVGANQAVLLQKIEELTLYIIEQNKKIEQLEKDKTEHKNLQKQIDELKAIIVHK